MTVETNIIRKEEQYILPQGIPSGTATKPEDVKVNPVFNPIKIRGIELKNRYVVSPMCMYSSQDGFMTPWHYVHYGQYALHGVGLVILEASGITPDGRITPSCAGIWKDEHIDQLKKIVEFNHSQGSKIGIQIGHSGRKGSTLPLHHPTPGKIADAEVGGWNTVLAPSNLEWDENHLVPVEISVDQIKDIINSFKLAAIRADKAGFDVLEIHGAHGYLIHEFLSPISNKRTDNYGGSFENRIRFLTEIIQQVRSVWPQDKPLFVRLSCTDWATDVEESWDLEQTVELSKRLYQLGVDLIDSSSAGNYSNQKIDAYPGFQVPFSKQIKSSVDGLKTGAVGLITEPNHSNEIIKEGSADLIFLGREFLRNPNFVGYAANQLNVDTKVAKQYLYGKRSVRKDN